MPRGTPPLSLPICEFLMRETVGRVKCIATFRMWLEICAKVRRRENFAILEGCFVGGSLCSFGCAFSVYMPYM
jgi:hypothetical protein